MSDISKCRGAGCPLANQCYRHNAPEGIWQSWMGVPYDHEIELKEDHSNVREFCQYYWKDDGTDEEK